jgi:hypothetical protein
MYLNRSFEVINVPVLSIRPELNSRLEEPEHKPVFQDIP